MTAAGRRPAEFAPDPAPLALSRRELVVGSTLSAIPLGAAATPAGGRAEGVAIDLTVNGTGHHLTVDPRTTLLDLVRDHLGLTGSKKGCDHGQCGACTLLVDGRRINSCLALAVQHDCQEIRTIEGLATGEKLHPVQAAMVRHDGFQCGFCTSGQICSAVGMLDELRRGAPSLVTEDLASERRPHGRAEIQERMSGNLCRCGAYPFIVDAIMDVLEGSSS